MNIKVSGTMLWLVCVPMAAWTQAGGADQSRITITKIEGNVPAKDAYIVRYYVDRATRESGHETGSLHILYSDKTEVVERDKRTIAWTEQFDNYGTSYSLPMVLAVYHSGKRIVEIQQGQMVWDWMFFDGGKHIAAVWGPVHFSDVGDYQLYDTETGHTIDEVLAAQKFKGGPSTASWQMPQHGRRN